MAEILVTGGLGFIGSNLVPELRKRGHKVWVCDLGHQPPNLELRTLNLEHITSAATSPNTASLRGYLKNTILIMSII